MTDRPDNPPATDDAELIRSLKRAISVLEGEAIKVLRQELNAARRRVRLAARGLT